MTTTKSEDGRSPRPRAGGYYWFPAPAGDAVEWSVLTCHDLGFGPDDGHFDMWPSVIDRLATAWVRDVVRLRRRLGGHCYGLPRGRVTRPDRRSLILHGDDAPIADWLGRVVERFDLDRRTVRLFLGRARAHDAGDRRRGTRPGPTPVGGGGKKKKAPWRADLRPGKDRNVTTSSGGDTRRTGDSE